MFDYCSSKHNSESHVRLRGPGLVGLGHGGGQGLDTGPVHGHQDDGVAAELALVSEFFWRG
jgi:hypothetical protein